MNSLIVSDGSFENYSQSVLDSQRLSVSTIVSDPLTTSPLRSAKSLLFVDPGVDQYQSLIAEVTASTEVHVLDAAQDAIVQITETLAGRSGIASLQILSHGAVGRLQLGSDWIDSNALQNHATDVRSWSLALTQEADILLYGCDVAAGETGDDFIRSLSQLTGADVAASNNLTGNAALGGDWTLEAATGQIETPTLRSEAYRGILAPVLTLPSGAISYTENANAIAVATGATVTNPGSFNGGNLTVSLSAPITSDRTADRLSIRAEGLISVDGKSIRYNGTTIGNFTGGYGSENLVVTFTSTSANATAVQALLQTITYTDASDNIPITDTRTLSAILNDGVENSQTVAKTINLTGINDAPVIGTRLALDSGLPLSGTWLAYQDSTSVTGGTATTTKGVNGITLNTDNTAYAGFSNYAVNYSSIPPSITMSLRNTNFPVLDRSKGFVLSFTAQLNSESPGLVDRNLDGKTDRSGFSVIILGNDLKGIELGFRGDRIFAQEDGTTQINPALEPDNTQANKTRTLFTQGEFTTNVTTTSPTEYDLGILGDIYTLYSSGVAILSGKVRDYTSFKPPTVNFGPFSVVPPSPYQQKNLIFLGDNTSSAAANVTLSGVEISTNSALPTLTVKQNASIVIPNVLIGDVDVATNPLTVTLTTLNGKITVKTNVLNGLTNVTGNGTGTVKVTGTSSQINTTLANAGLTYQSNLTFSGTETITLKAEDFGATGGAPTTTLKAFTLNVTPDPTISQRRDIVWRNSQSGETELWQINGLTFTAPVILTTVADLGWKIAATADFDRNGTTDLLWFNDRSGEVGFWKMNGTTLEKGVVVTTVGLEWKIQGTGDFDRDGKRDILWRNFNTGQIAFWKMDDMSISQGIVLSPIVKDTNWQIQGTGDFDGDGKLDILWRNFGAGGEIGFWKLNDMSFESPSLLSPAVKDAAWQIRGIGDFDGDGNLDLLWHNTQTGDNAFWKLNKMSFDQGIFTLKTPLGWQIEGTSDFDGDGKLDLLWRNYSTGETALWKMNGMTFAQGVFLSVKDLNWTIEGIDRFDKVV